MGSSDQIRVIILGAGKGGTSLLELLRQLPHVEIVGITDKDPHAPGLEHANSYNIPVTSDFLTLISQEEVDLILDVTGDPTVPSTLHQNRHPKTEILEGKTSKLLWDLIVHEQQLETNLIQSEKLASIGTFVSSIAHDVNNPLYVILGLAQSIAEDAESESIRDSAKDIVNATRRISKMCHGLTLYSRKPSSQEQRQEVDLNSQLEEALTIAHYATTLKEVTVKKEFDPQAIILANKDEILQVLVNLVINAVHAMKGRGILLLHSASQNGTVTMKVTDTGCGIPEQHLKNLFVPFFTTKPAGVGTGLGLYSAKSITEKFGGHISVQSKINKGTTFALHFPALHTCPS